MKNKRIISIALLISVLLSSCSANLATFTNINNNITNVQLNKNNFKVVDRVSGESTVSYLLGMAVFYNKSLLEKATGKMLEKANLIGNSRAIVNVTTETDVVFLAPFYLKKTITVSANVIEFTK